MSRHPLFPDGALPISGEVQFWRMHPDSWEPALRAVRDIGIDTIATYLSWRRHEPTAGSFDLRGGHGDELDVHRFLGLCRDLGLRVILKPGPWICAEERNGGFPDWIVRDEGLLARDHRGEPVSGYNPPFKHPMPSYASRRFRQLTEQWLQNVWSDLAPFLGADGPIIGTQYDNEPSLGFQDSMYGFDYHPEALASWFAFAGTNTAPPVPRGDGGSEPTELERQWALWQRHYISDFLAWLQETSERVGAPKLAGTINLNTHPVRGWPQDGGSIVAALEATVVGEDHYFVPPLDQHDLAGLAIAEAQARISGTPLVWAPEMQAGIWRSPGEIVEYPDPTVGEMIGWWSAALAFGYRGFNLYMLVNRENWEAAPISNTGAVTDLGEALRQMLVVLRSVPNLAGFDPVPDEVIDWNDEDRISAYRVRGTQASPLTAWDDERARRGYDTAERAALQAVTAGRQFTFHHNAHPVVQEHPPATAPFGHLVRLHQDASGRRLIYLVRWHRDAAIGDVVVDIHDSAITRVRRTTDGAVSAVDNGRLTFPEPAAGIDLYWVD